jgi:GLPGLI family protein
MKNNYYLVSLLVFVLPVLVSAQQQKGTTAGKIDYEVNQRYSLYIPGKTNGIDTASLYFNDTASAYLIRQKPITKEDLLKQMGSMAPEYREIAVQDIMRRIEKRKQNLYYHKGGSNIISYPWESPLGDKSFCVFDTIPSFSWDLLPDTTRILGFLCQKAVFKSRAYDNNERAFTAWFTPDIALAYGPYRFFGLPGMIMELDNQYFNYKAVAVNMPLPAEGKVNIACCAGLPSISKKQAGIVEQKQRTDYSNMQKLNSEKN